ncbi:hypothetical protein [Deinococcus hopiensis]|uniref:Uncharacterized protein n=1 Tax=Deinococcus hopiensis KR-140 TaxID=695939 RepID=A0A1W1UK16_9DEIO|nr:hypothetical protein [Deinococcus hopiensis]SMB81417.1 hypothetical protein SAMN00790413_04572 [Deinococcus hopiensis KR-140]
MAINLPDTGLEAAFNAVDTDVPRDFALLLAPGLRERTRVTTLRHHCPVTAAPRDYSATP